MVVSLQDSRLFRTVACSLRVAVCSGVAVHTPSYPSFCGLLLFCHTTLCPGNSPTPLPVCSLPYFTPSPGSCVPCPPRHLGEGEHLHHLPRAKNRKGKRQQENTPQVELEHATPRSCEKQKQASTAHRLLRGKMALPPAPAPSALDFFVV